MRRPVPPPLSKSVVQIALESPFPRLVYAKCLKEMAGAEGLEPPTCGFGDRRSTN